MPAGSIDDSNVRTIDCADVGNVDPASDFTAFIGFLRGIAVVTPNGAFNINCVVHINPGATPGPG